jgi:DNA-binding IclR family transcriptional regulator
MRQTRRADLTDALLVLAVFAREPFATAEDVATTLGVPVDVVAKLCADLEAAGMIERTPLQ